MFAQEQERGSDSGECDSKTGKISSKSVDRERGPCDVPEANIMDGKCTVSMHKWGVYLGHITITALELQ